MGHFTGRVWSPVITPFTPRGDTDIERFLRHARWLVDNGLGLAVFGTNSEANSLSVDEKKQSLDALVEGGIPPSRLMPGTGACALPDVIEQTRHAVGYDVAGVLMLPPFYYKGVSDEGLFRYYAQVIEAVADPRLRIYIYHIPAVSQTPLSLALIERLIAAYPGHIVGVKDSSGDWSNTQAMIDRFGSGGFQVYAGSDTFLLDTLRAGGAGCISATANVNPGPIAHLAAHWEGADADDQQAALVRVRQVFEGYPMIPALKAVAARYSGHGGWASLRPPLVELDETRRAALFSQLDALGFEMPGLIHD
ncbi:dihydrodipicolinate synthase family protein [Pseudomonas sp. Marseille-QA0892]